MDRGGAWDEKTNSKLNQLFGTERFDPSAIQLSFQDKKKIFDPLIIALRERSIRIITVAGTNGKGETSRLIHKHLKNEKNIGVWTSPHILSVRERFIFNETLITEDEFSSYLSEVPKLSYYETLFYIFCKWMSQQKELDLLILEVGLGGRLDAVNFFEADLVCLTSISRDHCEILGDRLKDILREKLGVCRKNTPLISALTQDHLNEELKAFAKKNSIPWVNLAKEYENLSKMPYWEQNMLSSLAAEQVITHGIDNFSVIDLDDLPAPHVSPGRFEQMTLKKRRFIFIGAHNLDGLRQLVQSVFKRLSKDSEWKTLFSLSSRPDEEISAMMDLLLSCERLKKGLVFCEFKHPRALASEKLFSLMEVREKKGKENIKFAKDWFKQIENDETESTLVLGSYYFIGEVQKHLLHLNSIS